MLKLFNTLTRKKETFKPQKKTATVYTCGPTVYDFQHIGNLRSAVFGDVLRRAIEYNGNKVKLITNITDIEDKIFKRAKKERKDFRKITDLYTELYLRDLKKLNIKKANKYPRVTENIKDITRLVGKLVKKGFAYKRDDGSVYFDISKFKDYGKLAKLGKVKLKAGARVSSDEYDKDNVADFVLWKARKAGEPAWKSPFSDGRPGWHIECSVLAMKYLGNTIDIHTGGVDLIFPHHTNEIAQSEAATGKKFVNYWIHGEHLLVDGKKMAKSAKNFYTLNDLNKKGFSALAFRYFTFSAHYRAKLNFTWKALESASHALDSLYHDIALMGFVAKRDKKSGKGKTYEKKFKDAVNDDLNLPKALSVIHDLVADKKVGPTEKRKLLFKFDEVLGLGLEGADEMAEMPKGVKRLVDEREKLRRNQQFTKSDSLREDIERLGYIVEDTDKGPFVWPIKM